jgi:putative ABC transport system permease protein
MENELERDLQDHIDMDTRENIERGMAPEEARRAAIRKFGNVARVAEETRAVWRWMWAERLGQDMRYALRGLRRNPLFATVAVLTLALGIGMNTAVFSVVSSVLIKPLPYPDAARLMWVVNVHRRFHFEAASAPDFSDWKKQAQSFEQIAAYTHADNTIQDGDESAKHAVVAVTPEFWQIAGAHAALGRLFGEGDRNMLVLTWRMFQERFGGDAGVIGRAVRIDGRQATIAGVLSKEFRFLPPRGMDGGMSGEAEAFTPAVIGPEMQARGPRLLIMFVVGKLKTGVPPERARAELQGIQDRIARENPQMSGFYRDAEIRVMPLQERLVGESRRALLVLLAGVAFVLLITCANLGNLLLARATARQREIAIRAAIGAGRSRLVRQFLVEGLTLAMVGGATGVALAAAVDRLLVRISPAAVPRLGELAMDWRVFLFAFAISIAAGLIFGLAPVLSLPLTSLYSVLKDGARGSFGARAGMRLRQLVVAAELALALVLLTGAGLMVKSFARMYAHPAGFEPEKIGTMKVWLSGPGYRDSERSAAVGYAQRLLDRVSQTPGVQDGAVTSVFAHGVIEAEGRTYAPGEAPQGQFRFVSPEYGRVLGLPLLRGRWLGDETSNAVVLNQTLARRLFSTDDVLGRQIRVFALKEPAVIVGVMGDLKISRLDADAPAEVLIPYRRGESSNFRRMEVLIRTASPAAVLPQVRKAAQGVDPSQPPYGVTTLEQALSESIAPRRFHFLLLGTFAATAVLLALIGIYGVMSYIVTQRTQEMGVRVALGARRGALVWMVVRQGMTIALVGIALGIAAALSLGRAMQSLLFEVKPNDPPTFAAVAALMAATALMACIAPAAKAARVDALVALRYE